MATAALLRIVPPNKFNMNFWTGRQTGDGDIIEGTRDLNLKDCGTIACALGHAISAFPQITINNRLGIVISGDTKQPHVFNGYLEAAQYFYRIPLETADHLFTSSGTSLTKEDEADRLEAVAAGMLT